MGYCHKLGNQRKAVGKTIEHREHAREPARDMPANMALLAEFVLLGRAGYKSKHPYRTESIDVRE